MTSPTSRTGLRLASSVWRVAAVGELTYWDGGWGSVAWQAAGLATFVLGMSRLFVAISGTSPGRKWVDRALVATWLVGAALWQATDLLPRPTIPGIAAQAAIAMGTLMIGINVAVRAMFAGRRTYTATPTDP